MARVFKRGSKWWIDCFIEGQRVRETGGDTKMEALFKLRQIKKKIKETKFLAPVLPRRAKKNLKGFVEEYLAFSKANKKGNTHAGEILILKRFLKFIRNKQLCEITTKDIEDFKVDLMEGKRAITVNNNLKVIKTMLNAAVKWGYLDKSPGRAVKLLPEQKKLPKFLTVDEIQRLLEATPSRSYAIIYTLLKTGMRRGEVLNLRWEDIDFDRNVIKVKKAKSYRPREIPIDEKLKSILTNLPREDGKIFRISRFVLHMDFDKARKVAGLDIHIHGLRHTFASQLVIQGASLFAVKELLGHSDIKTTMIYAHLSAGHLQEAVKKLKY